MFFSFLKIKNNVRNRKPFYENKLLTFLHPWRQWLAFLYASFAAAEAADLIDTEIYDMDVSDVEDRSDEQRWDDPNDDQDNDRSSLSRVQLLTASRWHLHGEVVVDA